MNLRQRLDNLPVGQKLLAALLILLATVLLVANLAFISAAYWISQESVAPQAMQTIGRLIANPALSQPALSSPQTAEVLLRQLNDYQPLRAAALYDSNGLMLADLQRGDTLKLPARLDRLEHWRRGEYRLNALIELPQENARPGYLLLVASGELPSAFYTGTLTASLAILGVSVLLWLLVAQQIRRLITRPIRDLEELSRQVTREENYALRAQRGNGDEIGRLADAFNTMLTRIEAREQQLKRARDDAQEAVEQAQSLAEETRRSNRKLELEVQVRSKIEKKLTGFQHYLNSIIDSMPSALIAVDEQLYVTQWNQEASQLSGTSLDDAVNQPVFLAFPSLKPFLPQLTRAAEKHSVERVERVTWALIDTPRHYALTFYPLMGGTGRGAVIRIDDITQRLSLEEVMVQSEKMLSVGSLAAGMAHEINNPLGAILHNVQNIKRRLSPELAKNVELAAEVGVPLEDINHYLDGRDIPRLLEGIQHAGSRAAKIVTHMLAFSRRSHRQMTACELPALLEQAVEIAGNDFDLAEGFDFKSLQIVHEFDPNLGPVPVIANEVEQVLLNLLKNAAQAIHQRDDEEEGEQGRIVLRTRLTPPWAEVQVEDNGSGMPELVRKRIFEPFFTTKEVGQGTGLGLSVSYFIITNNHKGQMEVRSELGRGTCFSIRLPLESSEAVAPAQAKALPPLCRNPVAACGGATKRKVESMGNRLSKIYTRTGDRGETGLAGGRRVPKSHPRIEAIGAVDELNSQLGLLLAELLEARGAHPGLEEIVQALAPVQHRLFDLGGELAMPEYRALDETEVARLESCIDRWNDELGPLKNFILPAVPAWSPRPMSAAAWRAVPNGAARRWTRRKRWRASACAT